MDLIMVLAGPSRIDRNGNEWSARVADYRKGPTMKNLLSEARHEIMELRHENEILRAKVETMELFACVLHTQPASQSRGMAPDVAWALQKEIDKIVEQEKQQQPKAAAAE
jgi:hypothetical protein